MTMAREVWQEAIKLDDDLMVYALDVTLKSFKTWNLRLSVSMKKLVLELLEKVSEDVKRSPAI